jgi:hypothetical protein
MSTWRTVATVVIGCAAVLVALGGVVVLLLAKALEVLVAYWLAPLG